VVQSAAQSLDLLAMHAVSIGEILETRADPVLAANDSHLRLGQFTFWVHRRPKEERRAGRTPRRADVAPLRLVDGLGCGGTGQQDSA